MRKVLVVSIHPDDETLGCGGTLLKHRSSSDRLYWLILTNIDEQHGWAAKHVARRQKEIRKVTRLYGFEKTFKLDFPTTKLDTIPMRDLLAPISKVMNEAEPEIIYLPNRNDIHTDHQIGFKAVINCTKNFRFPFIERILMYECLSETEFAPALQEIMFIPNVFIDITDFFSRKLEIMKIFESEVMKEPLPRSLETIEALAKYRGSSIGKKYAEAFMLLKEIIF
jgi:N-acetylglucosamine malate deacetylase 1